LKKPKMWRAPMIDITELRKAAFTRRLTGGLQRVHWSPLHVAQVRHHISSLSDRVLFESAEMKLFDSRRAAAAPGLLPVHISRAMDSSALSWRVRISDEGTDLMLDQIKVKGWNLANFARNGPVALAHKTDELPVAQSLTPFVSGSALFADSVFPEPGISAVSDQVRNMVGAGMFRGASVGFIPGKFKFSTDPQRPFGIDFLEGHILTEWSFCSVPANPRCLVVGPSPGAKSARRNVPLDDVSSDDADDWQCTAVATMPIDASDDSFDAKAAKSGLLANFSPNGTILEGARDCFLASNAAAPFDASSYLFPFCRTAAGGIVASKVGWRQSFAALEKSSMSGVVIGEARAVVDSLEARLGDVKTADRRREARELVARGRALADSISDSKPQTREQRIVEAANFRRLAMANNK
jgi:hypothetical protein